MTAFRADFDLDLEVEGVEKRFKIVQFSGDWALNQIPKGMCALAIGREASDGETVALVHEHYDELKKMVKVKVYFRPSGEYSADEDWPEDEVVIFDGRLEGLGNVKINGKIHFAVYLTHWLADIDFSSAISELSHPANPKSYVFQSVFGNALSTNVAQTNGLYATSAGGGFNPNSVREDLWGQVIKPIMCNIAKAEHVRVAGELSACLELKAGRNDMALAVLKRIEGVEGGDNADCDLALSPYTRKLTLEGAENAPTSVSDAIYEAINSQTEDSFVHQTLWGKLITYAAAFRFAIVPLIDKAIVVPFTPGLRDGYCKEILVNDYDYIKLSATLKRPTRAMAIFTGVDYSTGAATGQGGVDIPLGMGGCYAPEDAGDEGMLHIINAPGWLRNIPVSGRSTAKSSGVKDKDATSSSTTPVSGKDAIKDSVDGLSKEEILLTTREMFERYARSAYIVESLRGRTGQLSGKLRFDISPGSTVRIEGSAEQHLDDVDDKLSQPQQGEVMRVSININAEQAKAGTSFTISHLRTESENQSDRTSVEQHPLYTTDFKGAPLHDDLQFGACE